MVSPFIQAILLLGVGQWQSQGLQTLWRGLAPESRGSDLPRRGFAVFIGIQMGPGWNAQGATASELSLGGKHPVVNCPAAPSLMNS